jgi:putative flippase GtrA
VISLTSQFATFSIVGLVAAVVHYGALIVLVETDLTDPVKANLVAYVLGGIASYLLNRRCSFRSERPHAEAVWRFGVVAGFGFLLTGVFTYLFQKRLGVPYLLAAVMTSAVVLFWSFVVNRLWTFSDAR